MEKLVARSDVAVPNTASPTAGVVDPQIPTPAVGVEISRPWPTPAPLASPAATPWWHLSRENAPRLFVLIWLAGALFFAARIFGQNLLFLRRLGKPGLVSHPPTLAPLKSCQAELGVNQKIRLAETGLVQSPALYGFFRPTLLLPMGTMGRFSVAELRHIFLHEMAHVKRGDPGLVWLVSLGQILHWFNPVLWFVFRRMAADRELACDELALLRAGERESRAYGETILKLVELCSRPAAVPALMGILEGNGQMTRRILMIARFKPRPRWSLLAVLLLLAVGLVTLTDAQTGVKPSTTNASTGPVLQAAPAPQNNAPASPAFGSDEILSAASFGDLEKVKALLKADPDAVFQTMENGQTALHLAASHGYKDMVELLLANKADVNAEARGGMTSLFMAAQGGYKDVVQSLLANKADVNAAYNHGTTPLHAAAASGRAEVVELLLNNKANVNARDDSGRTPLDLAEARGQKDVAELLRQHGGKNFIGDIFAATQAGDLEKVKALLAANPDLVFSKDSQGDTPLHAAAALGKPGGRRGGVAPETNYAEVAKLLLANKADVNAKDNDGNTPLHIAGRTGRKDVAESLLANKAEVNAKNSDGKTPLDLAVERENKDVAELLCASNADVNSMRKDGWTPLHRAVLNRGTDVAAVLLAHNANINAQGRDNARTPLLDAALRGKRDMVELLLTNNADVNAKDITDGKTPLHWAAIGGWKSVVALLLSNKADINIKDLAGRTPLDEAVFWYRGGVAELLMANKAEVNALDAAAMGDLERLKAVLKNNPDLVSSKDHESGRTPLHWAARNGQIDVAELLLSNKADVNAKDKEDITPLHLAGYKAMVELLLANKAQVNARSATDMTPLHVAARAGKKDAVELLLANKADINAKDNNGDTPLHMVADEGLEDMVELLLANKADVNARNAGGWTPLDPATAKNQRDVVKLLQSWIENSKKMY
jgi:ankyrin repeat protein